MARSHAALVFALLLTGCSSALKKRCESTNWFEYGKEVALSGRRLTSDNFAKQCQEEEDVPVDHAALDTGFKSGMSRYCLSETVYTNGKQGIGFNPELCDGSNIKMLTARHTEGVREYCHADNGYRVGAQGGALKKICPKDLAPAFEKRHSQGRMAYLNEMANQKEKEIQLLSQQERGYQTELFRKESLLASLPYVSEPKLRSDGKPTREPSIRERGILQQRDDLSRQISQLQNKIESLRAQQRQTQQAISEYKAEAVALSQDAGAVEN